MHRMVRITLAAALAALSLTATAAAQGRGRRKAARPGAAPPTAAAVTVAFTVAERDVIARYYAAHPYKTKRLPPGVARNLARGKPLPPGIAKRSLPSALVAELPRRSGVEIAIYGDRLVLLSDRGLVLDIMVNVFR
jgi:hypothetical protein